MIDITARLEAYRADSLLREQYIVAHHYINFASNDYLCLAQDSTVKAAFKEGVDLYGLGSGASAMVTGYSQAHKDIEQKFAEFLNRDQAVLFNSGYLANLGVISTLADKNSSIVADKLVHASLIDGIKLSQAKLRRFKHNDMEHAELILSKKFKQSLLITESIFSMEGDIAPAHKLANLASKYGSTFIIDDAHAIGVLGKRGRGICEYYNLTQKDVPCLIIPLGKAVGSQGAVVAGDKNLIQALKQFARTYIYTTALPPAMPHATLAALKIINEENWRRQKLNELILFFVEMADNLELPLVSKDLTPIKSILVGDNNRTLKIQKYLLDKGLFISCIRPPTVPKNTARIRISLNCLHSKQQILNLLQLIAEKYYE
ncbi:aminotransferase class I/II-fold pyridoxal phosphate-dependent enzyme [Rickettsiales endosymbiont of Stachyamoeba lipophora]|uniref:aminotransferase class I/II-fold pyridoxal phosphate-dependent enzyme n=1 Tax=Rickettsiales endosymbiont of Stachyamoeba lipophora TaxID=2486578 RepID=UPI000F64F89C|nr:8-amino-7-oxononanoate synthase [Rickettsiales endosymbiont of Stachyamoeba lipophora]AZL16076.1 8-amino-7-oxononanoate synthase [Rickettsiales endosymbiont of Stachyamoeba lipophora]